MKIMLTCILTILGLNGVCLLAKTEHKKPEQLFRILQNNHGWELADINDEVSISTKLIQNRDLVALMVKQKTSISLEILQEVIMDVKYYSDFLTGAGPIISQEIYRTDSWLDGYQFIPVDVPFVSNREYCFRMHLNGLLDNDSTSIVHWYLLKQDSTNQHLLKYDTKDAVQLDFGAGLWMAEKADNGSVTISYRLYMDPGGSIPRFLIDIVNEMSIVNIFKDALAEAGRREITNAP
tara:strand:+ start:3035 stop:3742 length:708 start_codon:yes stop_codon:yes gene_type:complete